MSDFNLESIVDELIEIESSLSEFRADLMRSIRAIVAAKPDTKFSDAFKARLRKELRLQYMPSPTLSPSPLTRMNKFFYAFGGAAVASLVLYITMINPKIPMPSGESLMVDRDGDRVIKGPTVADERNDEAFGTLAPDQPAMYARPQSGGGGGGMPRITDSAVTAGSKMIVPDEQYAYMATEYIYSGNLKLDDGATVTVMRRIQPKSSAKVNLLGGTFVEGLLNIGKLSSLQVINVSLSESGPEPLSVYVDFMDGSLSINRQIDYTLRPESNCQDEACFARFRLKESDMPPDNRVFEIATKFLNDLGVDMRTYGEPVIAYNWREMRSMQPTGSEFYFPESMDVSFPYLINGSPVYDEWGNASGMNVTVDVRLRAATGVWGINVMQMESSQYAAVTDTAAFLDIVRRGGVNYYTEEGATMTQAMLGDPKEVYVIHYKYDADKQENYELYVPALAFPVTKMPKGSYEQRKAVVIPLASELLQGDDRMVKPMPMPLIEGAYLGMPVPGSSVDEMEVYPDTRAPSGVMQRPLEDGLEE